MFKEEGLLKQGVDDSMDDPSPFFNPEKIEGKNSSCPNNLLKNKKLHSNYNSILIKNKEGNPKEYKSHFLKNFKGNNTNLILETNRSFTLCFQSMYDFLVKTDKKLAYKGIYQSFKVGMLDGALEYTKQILLSNKQVNAR
mmetsp:Transcript_6733/g.5870  ORF Transcript_6733/g.5870 Transcript_6733/m.5870 type:complete len:140 (+) Transcript_6733:858-1277(+)